MNENTNNSGDNKGSGMSAGAGVVIGAVIVIIVLVVIIILALPYVRGQIESMSHPEKPTINVTLPSPTMPTAPNGSTTPGY